MANSPGSALGTAGGLFNIEQGLAKGGVTGNAQAAIGSASLANKGGAFGGASSQAGAALGAAGGALGIYNGIQQGGVSGYGSAAVGAARVGQGVSSLAGDSQLAGELGSTAGYIAAPLAVYNAVKNYQSGATGSDTLNGAEAGAAIGSIIPGIGTVIGGVVGGVVGALSSAIGPGKTDQETTDVKSVINATSAAGNSSSVAASVQNPYVQLAGLFDDKSSTLPMYQQYGRMGEQKFTNDMVGQINTAYKNGTINSSSTPQQVYNSVVAPWVSSMGNGWSGVGTTYQATTQGLLQDMVGQYMAGTASQNWQAVGGDSPFSGLPAYGSGATPASIASTLGPATNGGAGSAGKVTQVR